jgi:hypothetical protein
VAAARGCGCAIDMITHGAPFLARVCGLVIHADTPIGGLRLLDAPEAPDLWVRMRGSFDPTLMNEGSAWYVSPDHDDRHVPFLTIRTVGSGYLLCYAEGTRFLVSTSGSQVDAWWDAPLTEVDAADYLLGGVLAFIVRLRGQVPLHASAVVVQDHAVLFLGAGGAGKSSIATAFAILGYPVLSDDIVVMSDSGGSVLAHPSHPRLSLWADSADALFATESLPVHSPVYAKRRLDLLEHGFRFHDRPLPVGMICVLASRDEFSRRPVIRALRPQTALMKLVSHTYGNYLLDASMRAHEFGVLGRVAASVRVSELSLGARLDGLVSDCQLLAGDLALQSPAHAI